MQEALNSTPVEQQLPEGERNAVRHGNLHHNVPHSRRGSDIDGNLSRVDVDRHRDYHKWAENMLPTEAVRFLAIESITDMDPDLRLDARQLHDVLKSARGYESYWQKAFIPGYHQGMAARMTQDLSFTARLLKRERDRVDAALRFLTDQTDALPPDHHETLMGARGFFGAPGGRGAIEGVLNEKNNKELSWCKTLKHDVRFAILRTLSDRGVYANDQSGYLWTLQEHKQALDARWNLIADGAQKLHRQLQRLIEMGGDLGLYTGSDVA